MSIARGSESHPRKYSEIAAARQRMPSLPTLDMFTHQLHWIPSGMPRRGDEYVDVSCQAPIRITPQTPRATWRNDTYFFCSDACRRRFAQAPDALLTARGVSSVAN